MTVPALAAVPIVQEIGKQLSHPVIGYRKTTVKARKNGGTVTKVKSFELRGWELGLGVLGVGALLAASYGMRMWKWQPYKYTETKTIYTPIKTDIKYERTINLPAANTDGGKDVFGIEVPKAFAAITPAYGLWEMRNIASPVPGLLGLLGFK